ncbi:MAG: ribose-phosphate pyrophosphokinase [Lachnospiraceae bacterium]|nr:ribose-phosphate pyrophosphokinase [Lachnospiraceae bacterium]MBQ6242168.1 ribose-phosphate pyrophosphokinase [Lachnospiraceae bacterium]
MEIRTHFGPLGIIALPGCEKLAKQVNAYLVAWRAGRETQQAGYIEDNYLIDVDLNRYGGGEAKAILNQTVRGYDLFIMVDVCNYSLEYELNGHMNPMSPDDHYMNLKRVISACTGKPNRINVVMPFLYESRQHRRTARESLDCAMMLQELVGMGVDNIFTFDAHDPRICNAIPLAGFENLPTSYQFVKTLINLNIHEKFDKDSVLIIAPDEGAVERAVYFANILGVNVSMFYKRRDYTKIVDGRNPIVAHEYLGESLEGKTAIVVDDMIASGDSIIDVAKQLKERGAKNVIACASFGLFTSGMEHFDKAVEEGLLDKVLTTNLIYQNPETLIRPYYESVDMSEYLASVVDTVNHNMSLERFISPDEKISNKLKTS